MLFELIGAIEEVEIIARGPSLRERKGLSARFGGGRW
jgi:hypothetical protein